MLGAAAGWQYQASMTKFAPAEMTLDELREELAPRVAANAVFDGWGDSALRDAAEAIDIPPERARLVFPKGDVEMIDSWFASIDREMERRAPAEDLAPLKIRDRITRLILTRLAIAGPQREAVRRAMAKLALPGHIIHATRLGWRSADVMWRLAGDNAVDFNHYSKRATLAGVYAATVLVWLDDDSEDHAATKAFLDRRIDGIMRFEKTKARLKPNSDRYFSPARFFGRLRYPDR